MAIVNVVDSSRNRIVLNRSTTKSLVKVIILDLAGKPIKSTKVIISDVTKQVTNGVTKKDGDFVFEYDKNINDLIVSFPLIKMIPDFNSLWNYHPRSQWDHIDEIRAAKEVKKTIGGKVDADWIPNTCAIRISRAFNYSGYEIKKLKTVQPDGKERWETVSGADKKWYMLRVDTFLSHILTKDFGKPDFKGYTEADFQGKKGLIVFKVSTWGDATGHLDLWDKTKCSVSAYFDKSDYVLLWQAKNIERISIDNLDLYTQLTFQIKEG